MLTNPVIDCLEAHRSIRRFKPEPVPEDVLRTILRAGTRAPPQASPRCRHAPRRVQAWTARGRPLNRTDALRSALMAGALALPYVAVLAGLYGLRSAWAALLLYQAGMVFGLLRGRPRLTARRLVSGWRTREGILLSLLCAGAGPILVLLWPTIATTPTALPATLAHFGLSGTSWRLFALSYVTVHPLLEEAFWRAPAPRGARRPPGFDLARDAAFAGYHGLVLIRFLHPAWALVSLVPLVLVSRRWRRTAEAQGGLAVPMVSHSVASFSTVAAVLWLLRA